MADNCESFFFFFSFTQLTKYLQLHSPHFKVFFNRCLFLISILSCSKGYVTDQSMFAELHLQFSFLLPCFLQRVPHCSSQRAVDHSMEPTGSSVSPCMFSKALVSSHSRRESTENAGGHLCVASLGLETGF